MTPGGLSVVVQRLSPQRMRTRLAVTYTVLFLLAGVALLAVTYVLLATVLLPAPASQGGLISAITHKPISPQTAQLLSRCKPTPTSKPLLDECKRAIATLEPSPGDQRASELVALRGASVIGLGVLAIASVGLGWIVSGRAVRPVKSITRRREAGFGASARSAPRAHRAR